MIAYFSRDDEETELLSWRIQKKYVKQTGQECFNSLKANWNGISFYDLDAKETILRVRFGYSIQPLMKKYEADDWENVYAKG